MPTDTRTPDQAQATERKLLYEVELILVETQRQLLECQEELAVAKRRLGERQAREGL